MKKYIFLAILILGLIFLAGRYLFNKSDNNSQELAQEVVAQELNREVLVDIETGMTFSIICDQAGIDYALMTEILESSKDIYDLASVRAGKAVRFYFDKASGQFVELIYPIDTEEELYVSKNAEGQLLAERKVIDYEVKIKTIEGSIDSSLYQSALDKNLDIRAIIELADVFAWTVDFGMGIRVGDTYKFIYEERYRNGEYVMPGKIIAAKFVNDGKIIEGYYFSEGLDEEGDPIDGYYHPSGESVQKIFLKNPVDFKYISSGFTTGRRYVEAFNVSTGHRAIDYAASLGTPIKSVGNGTVTFAGWSSAGYGNLVSIRHNDTFSTNYAHMSKILVKKGQKVSQGEIIGKVGSTGFSTGPHLHFEMVKNGTKINPMTIEIPSDKGVAAEKMEEFKNSIATYQEQLK